MYLCYSLWKGRVYTNSQFQLPRFRKRPCKVKWVKTNTSVTEEPGSSENQFQWILYINTYILLKLLLEMEE